MSATDTMMKTLEGITERLHEAEAKAPGPNQAAIIELIRATRALKVVVTQLVRAQAQAGGDAPK